MILRLKKEEDDLALKSVMMCVLIELTILPIGRFWSNVCFILTISCQ